MLNIINSSEKIERILFKFLNSKTIDELNLKESVRAVGDKIPAVVGKRISAIFSKYIVEFNILNSSKKICNVMIKDKFENEYYVDIITHNITKDFARPNITTVKTIEKLYKNNKNIFLILLIHYNPNLNKNFITKVQLFPIECLTWDCIEIGALGNGQLQIKNSSNIIINKEFDRETWKDEFQKRLMVFYKKQQTKINKRISQLMELTLF